MSLSVDRDFRDFRRFAGDGLSPAVLGALPVGEPGTGVPDITREMMRDAFNGVDAALVEVLAAKDFVEGIVSDAVSSTAVPIFSTVSVVRTITVPAGMALIYVSGRSVTGSGGTHFKRVSSSIHPGRFQDASGAWWEPTVDPAHLSIINGTNLVVVGIGDTGDYPDVPTAVAKMRAFSSPGGVIELRFCSPVTRGHLFQGRQHDDFIFTSSIGTVPLDAGFVGFSDRYADIGFKGNEKLNNLWGCLGGSMPRIGCLFDMAHAGANGIYPIWSSGGALVLPGAGVINAGYCGIEGRNSNVSAMEGVFYGANQSGARIAHAGDIAIQSINADDCCQNVDTDPETAGAIEVSRASVCHARLASAKRSKAAGLNVRRCGSVVFEDADFSDCDDYGVIIQGASHASGFGVTIQRTKKVQGMGYGLWVRSGLCEVKGGNISNNAGQFDIRIGDSSPFNSMAMVDVSDVTTTAGKNSTANINVDYFNGPTRYGVAWNAAVDCPLNLGVFSATGATRGKLFDDFSIMNSSVQTPAQAKHIAIFNPNGPVGGVSSNASSTLFLESSDEALKANLVPLLEEIGDIEGLLSALAEQLFAFDWLSARTLEPTGERGHGLIAQAVARILPQIVSPRIGEPGAPGWTPAQLDYGKLSPYLLCGWVNQLHRLHEQHAAIAALTSRITALEEQDARHG